ncbi:alpha-ketoacid dehydrogenase subunit beta [Roseomonas sp. AR75]|uniref:alpha-ketoacid dehydrogenase subunit beta n=1 Tax=Roseomonas sp. AR75 TaxID=2562311 RepID=UPI0010C08A3F|nr:transketolase C-terminal domain-containing protein [Roseomonas sp. AR75]
MTERQSYARAFVDALLEAMEEDASVSLIGSSPLGLGPQRGLTEEIRRRFPDRVFDPPTAEGGIAALGVGAAMAGARPIVDLLTGSFGFLAWMQVANEAAVAHLMSGGRLTCPVTFHCLEGVRGAGAPQHSQTLHAMLWNVPGLEIVVPATAADVHGLMLTAIRSPNPTFVCGHAKLLGHEVVMPDPRAPIPFGRADIKRRGRDVTILGISIGVLHALAAAEDLAREGIEAEVVDPRTLAPLDEATILESVSRTGRLVVVDEAPLRASAASEIAAMVAEKGFRYLRAPIRRVARADAPVPFSPPLEAAVTPGPAEIIRAVREALAG